MENGQSSASTLIVNGKSHLPTDEQLIEIGNNHIATSFETPLRPDAFELSDEEKIEKIEQHFRSILEIIGLDLTDDSLRGTPKRVAKMYIKEIFKGLNPANFPSATLFENKFGYNEMLVEKDISVYSFCEHHFLPIVGKAHVAYISSGDVIGLSKINRIVDYFSRRPQVQERLTIQIAEALKKVLNTDDVAVLIESKHFCVAARGAQDINSTTITSEYSGAFANEATKAEFLQYISNDLS
jgi:GTP cyclohydrolase I